MPFTTFLFDLDGTLIDSVADLATGINLLRGELALPPLDIPTVRSYVGDGATALVRRALPEGEFSEARLQRFLELYSAHLMEQTVVYPGILEFLELHAGRPMAVVTNKPLGFSLRLLEGLGLSGFFPVVLGGESCQAKKPDPAPVREALRLLGAKADSAVMIGDHHTDLKAGLGAGVRTCFCAWGIGSDDGEPYDFHAASPFDLPRLFPGGER
ncbi:haloacid dehalogenase [Desulfuromonas versatilis]|uniref:phosphoglycolate phosphatase n=1 Tax=Desulfuromonas versatilis TaxID=2802975 RepID=A0ABN6E3I3_9BACT|nr:HAD-IA family hydrolase [Desulfuromonas versatilis]BCR06369.1 haloacid dehalogenase [Desulfuromonas versatilis]